MSGALLLRCGPRPNGFTDWMAEQFTIGFNAAGSPLESLALRNYCIRPCNGCGACARPPHTCHLGCDGTDALLDRIQEADLVVFASPIFFYALPAQFKALIDRSQKFWNKPPNPHRPAPAIALLCAGRLRGRLLFAGATLTLRYFFKSINKYFAEKLTVRGTDDPSITRDNPDITISLRRAGSKWAHKMAVNSNASL